MKAEHRRILTKAAATTAVAVVAATVVFVIDRAITRDTIGEREWLEILLIPIVVGMPIATYIFAQAEKLMSAYTQLTELNGETERVLRHLREAHEIIAFAARHDKMTGFLNREHFLEALRLAHETNARDVLLILDADYFKRINDRFGHLKGDEALVTIANAIRNAVRSDDPIGRIGGEEFGVLLKNVFPSTAVDLAEQILRDVASTVFYDTEGGPCVALTVTICGAALTDFNDDLTEVLAHAVQCLYGAKRAGRNRVEFESTLVQVAQSMARRDLGK